MYKDSDEASGGYGNGTGVGEERGKDVVSGISQFRISEMMFSLGEKSWLFSAIAIGQILGTIPITHMTSTFGVR